MKLGSKTVDFSFELSKIFSIILSLRREVLSFSINLFLETIYAVIF